MAACIFRATAARRIIPRKHLSPILRGPTRGTYLSFQFGRMAALKFSIRGRKLRDITVRALELDANSRWLSNRLDAREQECVTGDPRQQKRRGSAKAEKEWSSARYSRRDGRGNRCELTVEIDDSPRRSYAFPQRAHRGLRVGRTQYSQATCRPVMRMVCRTRDNHSLAALILFTGQTPIKMSVNVSNSQGMLVGNAE